MGKKSMVIASLLWMMASQVQAEVAVSVSVGQPGFYGQIDIGEYYPRPQLVYPQPVIIQRIHVPPPPIYLHVPPGHAKQWSRYCGHYGACARPVYFVQDTWYNDVYVPRYQERRGPPDKHWKDKGPKGPDRDHPHPGRGPGPGRD